KGVSLPLVLFDELGRRRQFVVPLKRPDQTRYRAGCNHSSSKQRAISDPRYGHTENIAISAPFHHSCCRQDMGDSLLPDPSGSSDGTTLTLPAPAASVVRNQRCPHRFYAVGSFETFLLSTASKI